MCFLFEQLRESVWVLPAIEEWRHDKDCCEKIIIKSAQVGEVKLFCTMLLLLWRNRNKCYHNNHCDLPWFLTDKAKRVVDEAFSQQDQTTCAHSATTPVVWLPPYH